MSRALAALARGERFAAPGGVTVAPTYLPDLVNAAIDLLIDGESGIWHLTNGEPVGWADLITRACAAAGIDASGLEETDGAGPGAAPRPRYSAMLSEHGQLLPALDDALERYAAARMSGVVGETLVVATAR